MIVVDYNITDRLATNVEIAYDWVSSASIERLSQFPEQSGASGDNYVGGVVSNWIMASSRLAAIDSWQE